MTTRKIHVGITHVLESDEVKIQCHVNPGNPSAVDQPPFVSLYVGPAHFVLTAHKARDLRDALTRVLESSDGVKLMEREAEAENR
jgi:hypothetical protein